MELNFLEKIFSLVQGQFDYYYIMGLGIVLYFSYRAVYAVLRFLWFWLFGDSVWIEVVERVQKHKVNVIGQEISSTHPVYRILEGRIKGQAVTSKYSSSDISASYYQYEGDVMRGIYLSTGCRLETKKTLWIQLGRTLLVSSFYVSVIIFAINHYQWAVSENLIDVMSFKFSWGTFLTIMQIWAVFLVMTGIRKGFFVDIAKNINSRYIT